MKNIMATTSLTIRDGKGRFLPAASDSSGVAGLADRVRRGKRRKNTGKKKHKKAKGSSLRDNAAPSRWATLSEQFSGLFDGKGTFGKNIATNIGEVTNMLALRDIGKAMLGAAFYGLSPVALRLATGKNFDHNGVSGVVSGLLMTTAVGLLTGDVPFIAGGLSAGTIHAMYVNLDKQVIEAATGERMTRWDIRSDATMSDGLYENQPYPHSGYVNGQPAVMYSNEEMQQQLENGQKLKDMSEAGESVNHLADGLRENVLLQDSSGTYWMPDDQGGAFMCNENGDFIVDGNGNYFRRVGTDVMIVNENGDIVPPTTSANAPQGVLKPQTQQIPSSQESLKDGRGTRQLARIHKLSRRTAFSQT